MSVFGSKLRLLRESIGYTQEHLASKLGLSKSTIGMYELGQREPNFETSEAIADFFNVDMDYLYGRTVCENAAKRAFEDLFSKYNITRVGSACALHHYLDGNGDDINLDSIPAAQRKAIKQMLIFLKMTDSLSEEGRQDIFKYMEFVAQKEAESAKKENQV